MKTYKVQRLVRGKWQIVAAATYAQDLISAYETAKAPVRMIRNDSFVMLQRNRNNEE